MSNIDYLKVIGALSRTLDMEAVDIRFQDKSPDTIDVTMGAASKHEKNFHIRITGFSIELSFSEDYFSRKELQRWLSILEYELEQAFMRNIKIQAGTRSGSHVLIVDF
ncbi:MAG: hypothetical protein JXA07_14815 [Spirochaetes bacterium]|nr:hypothetical protein [Spirochaetota bacterium]